MKKIFLFLLLLPILAQAQLELPFGVRVLNPEPLDALYFNTSGTVYTNTAQVISQVPVAIRYMGQTFNVNGVEYWFGSGTADGDLIVKGGSSTGVIGTGSANRIPFWLDAGSQSFGPFWDNTNTRLGIGGTPAYDLDILGAGATTARIFTSGINGISLVFQRISGTTSEWSIYNPAASTDLRFYSGSDRFIMTAGGVFKMLTAPTTDNAETNILMYQSDGEVQKRTVASLGIITNSGAANELVKSDGTNIVGTGVTTSSTGLFTVTGNFQFTSTGSFDVSAPSGGGIARDAASTNTAIPVLNLIRSSSGTPANGIGGSLQYTVETSAGNQEIGAAIEAVVIDNTSTSEDFALVFKTMNGGSTPSEELRLTDNELAFPAAGEYTSGGLTSFTGTGVELVSTSTDVSVRAPSGQTVSIGSDLETVDINGGTNIISNGISNNGSGLKHARIDVAVVGSSGSDVITWGSTFSNTNYTVTLGLQTTDNIERIYITAKTASTVTIGIDCVSSNCSGTVHAIAIHD